MKKIVEVKRLTPPETFKYFLKKNNFTSEKFTDAYNEIFALDPISVTTIQSLMCGRRGFQEMASVRVYRIASLLVPEEEPEETVLYVMARLIFGMTITINE